MSLAKQVEELERVAAGNVPRFVVVGMGPCHFIVGRWIGGRYDDVRRIFSNQSEAEGHIAYLASLEG